MPRFAPYGFGWHRDLPDVRDYTPQHEVVGRYLEALESSGAPEESVDWRKYFSPPADQGPLAASVAHACAALVEYFERRATGRCFEPSVLFVYQASQRLMEWSGNSGIPIRAALRAIAQLGVPPARCWPYDPARVGCQPDAHVYAMARRFAALAYVRLDDRGEAGKHVLKVVRHWLAAGFPCVFGFPVPTLTSVDSEIPFPTVFDSIGGGQAVVAVGYDDHRRLPTGRGAILVRNSWGGDWGDGGYGWLPYVYVRRHLATDFWTLLSPEWLASGEFRQPQ